MRATHPHRKFAALLGAMLLVAPLGLLQAQQATTTPPPAESPERAVKVLRVRAEDASHIGELLKSFNVSVRTAGFLGIITIAGPPSDVTRAEQAVHEIEQLTFRTPASIAQDVELTVHFLAIMDEDSSLPPGPLREVVAELKKTFPFQGYKLLETIALRTRVGEDSQIEGLLPETLQEGTPPTKYVFQCRVLAIEPRQNSQLVRFVFLRTTIRLPFSRGPNLSYEEVAINTALEVLDGTTVVVGKAGSTGASRGYLLVLRAKVVK